MSQTSPSQEAIAERAYELWEQAGRPDGHDQEFWLRAEAELSAPESAAGVPPQTTPPASLRSVAATSILPAIKSAVKTADRRPASRRAPKHG